MSRLDLDAQTWQQLNDLLDQALDQPGPSRVEWIRQLNPRFDALKPHLHDLLSRTAAIETGDWLQGLPKLTLGKSSADPRDAPEDRVGETVGPYHLLQELGSGGMGAVWLAERIDGQIDRKVALKLPHSSWLRVGLAERMARERDILATLTHQNIAHLYDAGLTEDGQPFLAIEYVSGQPIDKYCAAHRLSLRSRLALFLQIADAVAYAHSKLVLHRDLKPANILVTPEGSVRLLDFGIAKLLTDGSAQDTRLTELSGRALTLDYASPEQILGQPLTTASDIYSLGVILYELLTDERPCKPRFESRGALEDAVIHTDPAKPSEVVASPSRKALRGDLDTVVLKALKKSPQERYQTVNAFGEDITRYLNHLPVSAQPDSGWYVLKKFTQRNRLGVAATAAATLAITIGIVFSTWQATVATREGEHAQAVEQFIESIFSNADPYGDSGRRMTAVELLYAARSEIDHNFTRRPELQVALLNIVGSSLESLGDSDAAESALRASLAEAQEIYGPASIAVIRARALLTDVYSSKRDTDALRAEIESLLPLVRQYAAIDSEPLIRVLKNQANLGFEEGLYDDIEAPAREAFETARRELGDHHRLTVEASTLLAEAAVVSYKKSPETILEETSRGLQFALAASDGNPSHAQVIRSRDVYARALGSVGQFQEALREQEAVVAAVVTKLGPTDRVVMSAKNSLSIWERRVGRMPEAVEHSSEALAILKNLEETASADYMNVLTTHGVNLLAARRPVIAELALAEAEKIGNELYGATHWDTLTAHFNRAMALAFAGRAEETHASFAAIADPSISINYPWWIEFVRGTVERLSGQPQAAAASQQRALSLIPETPRAPWDQLRVLTELGQAQSDLEQWELADSTTATAERLYEILNIEMHPAYAELLLARGHIQLALGNPRDALPRLTKVDAFWRKFDPSNQAAGKAANWLARCEATLGHTAAGQ